jgi:serine/threonine protein kinase
LGNEPDQEALDRVGTLLNDKWTLERLLGVGGMAAVYAARHRNGARAAIKVLHRDLSRHSEVRQRFQREGYAANAVEHPGVVKVLDDDVISSGRDEGTAYIVMELLEGESLQDRLERGQAVGEREFLQIAEEVLGVLEVAHERGVVHRDLKPENLFFAREPGEEGKERVKVLDFGLARLLQGQSITTYGLALGTPSFMSPEQATGRNDEIDGRTDLFALAATGFRLRTGTRIHEADNPVELVTKMGHLAAPRIRTVTPDASEPFARVIDRALEFKRDDRYENAAAMRADVKRAIAQLDAGAGAARVAPARARASAAAIAPEPTIELSESDIVRPPAYGIDESVRLPKRRSILPWLVLPVFAGVGVWLWLAYGKVVGAWFASGVPSSSAAASASVDAGVASRVAVEGGAPTRPRPPPTQRPPPTSTRR